MSEPLDQSAAVGPIVVPEIVSLPAQVDALAARRLGTALMAAFSPRVTVVIADMSRTASCDTSWARHLMVANQHAAALEGELRIVPSQSVLTVLRLAGAEQTLRIFPTVTAALTGASRPETEAAPPAITATSGDQIRVWSSRWLAVVTTPAEVGSENAQELWVAIADACSSHLVTIADMTRTVECGYDAVTALLMGLRCTDASGGELWLAVSAAVDRLISATPVSDAFPTFRGLRDALVSLPARRPDLV